MQDPTPFLRTTVALGDGTGTLQTQYTYEPFGVTTQTGATSTSSYKYTGREDDGSGLLYYRARYYHPRLQRFIAEDPIGFRGRQMNLYGYVRNAPTIYIDPYGLLDVHFPIGPIPKKKKEEECETLGPPNPVPRPKPLPDPHEGFIDTVNSATTFTILPNLQGSATVTPDYSNPGVVLFNFTLK